MPIRIKEIILKRWKDIIFASSIERMRNLEKTLNGSRIREEGRKTWFFTNNYFWNLSKWRKIRRVLYWASG